MSGQDYEQLTLFQGDSLASRLVLPGSAEARRTTVTSGLRCLELYRKSGPLGSLVRMLLGSSQWRSTRCYLTWKASGTPAKRLLFRLVPSMPRIDGIDVQLWPTMRAKESGAYQYSRGQHDHPVLTLTGAARMWPTPTRFDATCGDLKGKEYNGKTRHAMKLLQAAKMFPTPTARDYRSPDMNPESKRFRRQTELNSVVGGQLNPAWVEWLMGFPIEWTGLDA